MGIFKRFFKPSQTRSNDADQANAINQSQSMVEYDMNGIIITANDNFLNVMGYSLNDVSGNHHSMFFSNTKQQHIQDEKLWEELRHGNHQTRESKYTSKGGNIVWMQESYNPVLNHSGKSYMVIKFATDITELKVQSINDYRITEALDKVTTSIMVADEDNNIIYINKEAFNLFHQTESDIRKDIPAFKTDELIGMNIDAYHTNPSAQRNILASLSSTYHTSIVIGEHTFELTANPILTKAGERLGTIVEWIDRTSEINVENEVQSLVNAAQQGDLSNRISLNNKSGFLRRLSKDINNMVEVADLIIKDTVRVLGAMSKGDLSVRIESEYQGIFEKLKNDANKTNIQLSNIITHIKDNASRVNNAASDILLGNMDLNRRTESQAASIDETSSSMDQMTSSVKQNADYARQANDLVLSAQEQASQGADIVNNAVTAMHEINASSDEITSIITVIDEIAFQTNLLALNASVEAARAGEHGRGFAVVATEVRNLAGRSATAAKEIKDLISNSTSKVDEGSRLVNQSGETLKIIMQSVIQVTKIVGDIATASQEQANGVEQVNIAINEIDTVTQQNKALAKDASAAAKTMNAQSVELNRLVEFFKIKNRSQATFQKEESRHTDELQSPSNNELNTDDHQAPQVCAKTSMHN